MMKKLFVFLLFCSCIPGPEIKEIKTEFNAMKRTVTGMQTGEIKVGGNVNEPVTGWILAIGYAAIPVAFLVYLVGHRVPVIRKLTDKLKGKPSVP